MFYFLQLGSFFAFLLHLKEPILPSIIQNIFSFESSPYLIILSPFLYYSVVKVLQKLIRSFSCLNSKELKLKIIFKPGIYLILSNMNYQNINIYANNKITSPSFVVFCCLSRIFIILFYLLNILRFTLEKTLNFFNYKHDK